MKSYYYKLIINFNLIYLFKSYKKKKRLEETES